MRDIGVNLVWLDNKGGNKALGLLAWFFLLPFEMDG